MVEAIDADMGDSCCFEKFEFVENVDEITMLPM